MSGGSVGSTGSKIRERAQALEARVVAALQHPVARWVGFLVGLAALGFLVSALFRNDEGLTAILDLGPASWLMAAAGFALFHLTAIGLLAALGGRPAGPIWASAQLVKYLPVPASAAVGMVGSAVRHGTGAGEAVGLMVRQSLALVGGATFVAIPAVVAWLGSQVPGGAAVGVGGCVLLACGAIAFATRGTSRTTIAATTALTVAGWAVLAVSLALAVRLAGDPAIILGSAYAAGWVAGQVVVPVPAGLGVREAAMVALLQDQVGFQRALAIAIVTRLLHVLSDGAAAVVVFGLRASRREGV